MPTGIHAVNVANPVLNWVRGVAPSAIPGEWVKLHIGDPGAAGTANPSAVTTRVQATHNAASGGSMTLASVSASWSMTTTEIITHCSVWTAVTGGNFLYSWELSSALNVANLDILTLILLTVGTGPIAA